MATQNNARDPYACTFAVPAGIRSVEVRMDDGSVLPRFVTRKAQGFEPAERVASDRGTMAFRHGAGVLVVVTNAVRILPALVALVHEGLRTLAGMCDHAQDRDGQGFCKDTRELGHSLAEAARLSTAQALAGAKLVRRFRRQLSGGTVAAAEALLTVGGAPAGETKPVEPARPRQPRLPFRGVATLDLEDEPGQEQEEPCDLELERRMELDAVA